MRYLCIFKNLIFFFFLSAKYYITVKYIIHFAFILLYVIILFFLNMFNAVSYYLFLQHLDHRAGCIYNLMCFYDEIEREEMFTRYVYKLANIHSKSKHYEEVISYF